MSMNENEFIIPSEQVIRGLKAKLVYEESKLVCTPADRCACDSVLRDITVANEWLETLPGEESMCDGG